MRILTAERERVEDLLCRAIDCDQLIVLEVDSLNLRIAQDSDFALALNAVFDHATKNARALRVVRRLISVAEDEDEVPLLEDATSK